MFKQPPSQPPYPDAETCVAIATVLSGHMPQNSKERKKLSWGDYKPYEPTDAEQRYRERVGEAIRTLRQLKDHPGSFSDAFIDPVVAFLTPVLDEAAAKLRIRPLGGGHPQQKPWAVLGFMAVLLAHGAIQDLSSKEVGTTANSRAARFAEFAVHRVGWRDAVGKTITRGALAKYYAKFMA